MSLGGHFPKFERIVVPSSSVSSNPRRPPSWSLKMKLLCSSKRPELFSQKTMSQTTGLESLKALVQNDQISLYELSLSVTRNAVLETNAASAFRLYWTLQPGKSMLSVLILMT
jgi:hypothetical protein